MTTEQDVLTKVNEVNAAADTLAQLNRELAALLKDWPSHHIITFSSGEQMGTNLFHGKWEIALDALLKKLAPHVTKWQ